MKRIYIYVITVFALLAGACSDNNLNDDAPVVPATPDIVIPEGAAEGELLIKFVPEMTEILDRVRRELPPGRAFRQRMRYFLSWERMTLNVFFQLIRAPKKRAVRRDCIFGIWYVLIKIRI